MTLEEFIMDADAYHRAHPRQRKGQAYFNYLASIRPDLTKKLQQTARDCDPFYHNHAISFFLLWLNKEL